MKEKILKNNGATLPKRHFVKLMVDDICSLFSLTKEQTNLFYLMVRDCLYGNRINMTPARKKVYVDEMQIKSQKSLNNMLRAIELSGIAAREECGSTAYLINPNLVFKGNDYQQIKMIITYNEIVGRDIKIEVE